MTDERFNGSIPLARYQDQQLPEYEGNPLISALPPIPDLQAVVSQLQALPSFSPKEAFLDGRVRAHAIARLLHGFFQPLNHHLELESKISLMIRQGYIGRNPANGAWYSHLQNGYRRVEEEDLDQWSTRVFPLRQAASPCSVVQAAVRPAHWSVSWECILRPFTTQSTISPN